MAPKQRQERKLYTNFERLWKAIVSRVSINIMSIFHIVCTTIGSWDPDYQKSRRKENWGIWYGDTFILMEWRPSRGRREMCWLKNFPDWTRYWDETNISFVSRADKTISIPSRKKTLRGLPYDSYNRKIYRTPATFWIYQPPGQMGLKMNALLDVTISGYSY